MTNEGNNLGCARTCGLIGAAFGILVAALLMVLTEMSTLQAIFLGLLAFLLGTIFLIWAFCKGNKVSGAGVAAGAAGVAAAGAAAASSVSSKASSAGSTAASGVSSAGSAAVAGAAAAGSAVASGAGAAAGAAKSGADKAATTAAGLVSDTGAAAKSAAKKTTSTAKKTAAKTKTAAKSTTSKAKSAASKTASKAKSTASKTATKAKSTASKAKSTAKKAAPKPPVLFTSRPDSVDDLKLIKGVGPKLEKTCNGIGVYQFAQIANWKKADIATVDDKLSFKGRIERDEWVKQAKILAKGGETEFSKRSKK